MSRYTFSCPHCGIRLQAPLETVGEEGDCKSCGRTFVAPPPPRERLVAGPAPVEEAAPEARPGPIPITMPRRRGPRLAPILVAAVVAVAVALAGWRFGWPWLYELLSRRPVVGTLTVAFAAHNRDLSSPRSEEGVHFVDPGIPLEVLEATPTVLKVRAPNPPGAGPPLPSGPEVWLPRGWLCSPREYARRKRAGHLPMQVMCVTSRRGHGTDFVFYGGIFQGEVIASHPGGDPAGGTGATPRRSKVIYVVLQIPDEQPSSAAIESRVISQIAPGQGLWFDPAAKGKRFKIGGHEFVGDPTVLYFVTKEDKVVKLPIWARDME